jgi:hypothetical protein
MTIVARVRTSGPFALLLTQADDSSLVATLVRLDEHLAIIRVVFYEEDEESGEEEGENAGAEEGHKVPEGRREGRRRGEVRPGHRGRE